MQDGAVKRDRATGFRIDRCDDFFPVLGIEHGFSRPIGMPVGMRVVNGSEVAFRIGIVNVYAIFRAESVAVGVHAQRNVPLEMSGLEQLPKLVHCLYFRYGCQLGFAIDAAVVFSSSKVNVPIGKAVPAGIGPPAVLPNGLLQSAA